MSELFSVKDEILYINIDTKKLHAIWAPFKNKYGIFFILHTEGAYIITPDNENELFFRVKTNTEEVVVQTEELSLEDEKLALQLRDLLNNYNITLHKKIIDI